MLWQSFLVEVDISVPGNNDNESPLHNTCHLLPSSYIRRHDGSRGGGFHELPEPILFGKRKINPHLNLDADPPSSQNTDHSLTEEQISFSVMLGSSFRRGGIKGEHLPCTCWISRQSSLTSASLHNTFVVYFTTDVFLGCWCTLPEPVAFYQCFGQV